MKTTDKPILVEQTYKSSIAKLWKALTDLDEMKQWFFHNIPSFKAEVGFETRFTVQSEDRIFTHQWKITDVIHFQKITYGWKYEEYPGDSFTTFELIEEKDQVKLRLTHKVIEDFPEEIPEFSRESCIGGWNYFLGENLKPYLEKNPGI